MNEPKPDVQGMHKYTLYIQSMVLYWNQFDVKPSGIFNGMDIGSLGLAISLYKSIPIFFCVLMGIQRPSFPFSAQKRTENRQRCLDEAVQMQQPWVLLLW